MSFSGALGRGTYQGVIAGAPRPSRSYAPMGTQLARLRQLDAAVRQQLQLRDAIFDNKFKENAVVNGVFRLSPPARRDHHYDRVMPAIRKRAILVQRLREQRAANEAAVAEAARTGAPDPRAALATPDAAAYFAPEHYTAANNWPNFWQHPTQRHVVPRVKWARHPELGGITRVSDPVAEYATSY